MSESLAVKILVRCEEKEMKKKETDLHSGNQCDHQWFNHLRRER
jgi:hypothetical protein